MGLDNLGGTRRADVTDRSRNDGGGGSARRLRGEGLRTHDDDARALSRELRPHRERTAKNGVLGHETAVVRQTRHVCENWSIESRREASGDVAPVVTGRDEDRVGRTGTLDERLD